MKLRTTLLSLALVTGLSGTAIADEQKQVDTAPNISLNKAMEIALAQTQGTVSAAAEKHFNNLPVFVVMIEADTSVSEKLINGLDGKIMGEITVSGTTPEITEFLEESVFEHDIDLNEEHEDDVHNEHS